MVKTVADRARRAARKPGDLTEAERAVLALLQRRLTKLPRSRAS
jgi:hypothetical protein